MNKHVIPESLTEQARLVADLLYTRWADQWPDAVVTVCTQGSREVEHRTAKPKRPNGTIALSTGEEVAFTHGDRQRLAIGGKSFGGAGTVSIADPDAIVARALAHLSDPSLSGYISANIQTHPDVVANDGRGTAEAHDGFTALYLDIDVRRDPEDDDEDTLASGHRAKSHERPLPTMTEAKKLMVRVARVLGGGAPFRAAIVQQTSDEGLHAIWPLAAMVPPHDPHDPTNIAARWDALTQGIAADMGVHLDSVSKDLARVLRLPGQRRLKGNARGLPGLTDRAYDALLVRIEAGDSEAQAEYERLAARPSLTEPSQTTLVAYRPDNILTDEHLARLPMLSERTRTSTNRTNTNSSTRERTGDYQLSAADLAVDAMDPLELASVIWDIDQCDGNRFKWCNSASPTSGEARDGLIFVNSETMQTDCGLGQVASPTSMMRWLTGDNSLARRLINHLGTLADETERLATIIKLVSEPFGGDDLDRFRAGVCERLADSGIRADRVAEVSVDADTEVVATVTSDEDELLEAIARRPDRHEGHEFTVTTGGYVKTGEDGHGAWRLVVGGPEHGTYLIKRVPVLDDEGEPTGEFESQFVPLTNAVLVRTSQHRLLRTLDDEDPVTFDVTVTTPLGRTVVRDLSPEHSLDIGKVLALANVGGTVPDFAAQREIRNCIANTGVGSQEQRVSFARAGWSDSDGVLRYVTTGNSFGPDGVDPCVRVEGGDADVVTALGEMPIEADFARLPQMLTDAAALVPGKPVIAAALIMQAVAAPVRCTGPNTTLWVTGKTGSGKTRLTYLANMWAQGAIGHGAPWEIPVVDMKKTTAKGPSQAAMLHGDVAALFDDIRVGGSDGEQSIREQMRMARDVIGLTHDRRGRAVAGRDQRLRSGGQCDTSAIITSEVTFPGSEHSMTAKMIVLPELRAADVDFGFTELLDLDGNPVLGLDGQPVMRYRSNAFYERYSAMANRIYTGWIAWLWHDCMTHAGGKLREWAVQNEARRQDMAGLLSTGRTQQVVARLLAGWARFREYVAERSGISLPDWHEYAPVMLASAAEAVDEQTEEHALITALRDALETQRGHLASGTGEAPRKLATQVGWADRGGPNLTPCGPLLGWISDNAQWVVMSTSHAQHLQPNSTKTALARTLTSLVPDEDKPRYESGTGQKQPRTGFGQQLRGWKIPATVLGIETDDTDEASDTKPTAF